MPARRKHRKLLPGPPPVTAVARAATAAADADLADPEASLAPPISLAAAQVDVAKRRAGSALRSLVRALARQAAHEQAALLSQNEASANGTWNDA